MKTTPLYLCHLKLNAQMTEFAGYQMPVRYTGDKLEHLAVRQEAGIFDVSHMGEIWVTGPLASQAMTHLLTQDVSKYTSEQAFYGVLLNSQGGIVDDVITYKFSPEKFLICVNASNREKDFDWIKSKTSPLTPLHPVERGINPSPVAGEVFVEDASDDWCQLAIQGPKAIEITASYLGGSVREIKRFGFKQVGGLIIARTGYTGEDGFEIFVPNHQAVELWDKLAEKATPCGLAARDTLRLEAGMCLYGHDINDETTPWEAGLGWCVKGEGSLPKKRLMGLVMQSTGIARPDYEVCTLAGDLIGHVTSGTKTPYLNQAIAMAYINYPYCEPGQEVY